ncbi:MAG: hypothetical protein ACLR0U_07860 [Enterocloster clostridioformis]
MPRRYGPDGTRLWYGKAPEDFNEADVARFSGVKQRPFYKSRNCWAEGMTQRRLPGS